jgi:hypothetical protein
MFQTLSSSNQKLIITFPSFISLIPIANYSSESYTLNNLNYSKITINNNLTITPFSILINLFIKNPPFIV